MVQLAALPFKYYGPPRRRIAWHTGRHLAYNCRQMTHKDTGFPGTASQTIGAVRKGFPTERLNKTARLLAIDRALLLHVLGISERTLQRKHLVSARLSPAASDRLARIDRIYNLAVEVFGDGGKAAEWLKRPSRALGNESPLRFLDTDAGTQQVERELRQIQHGFVY
jgi:putative toxin-antitoxin system antitoxin component (TIGR02293 family)